MARNYVVDKAQLTCTLGTAPGTLKVVSQQKLRIQGKLKATSEDKLLEPPFFGNCKCSSPTPPCSPALQEWQFTSKKSRMGNKTFLMDDSQVQCSKGGLITVKDPNQALAGTGKKEDETGKKLPRLQGETVFVNGYHSDAFGGIYNALMDIVPDGPHEKMIQGQNVNEYDRADPDDILTKEELEQLNEDMEEDHYFMYPVSNLISYALFKAIDKKLENIKKKRLAYTKEMFWGYWNDIRNRYKGSETYARYFNAGRNEHFINGSHGLASNGAHRVDHGIALGYIWAKHNWMIKTKEEVDQQKETAPYIESYSPAYKPVTVTGHSQGAAACAGVVLGILYYAAEKGWPEIPVNIIFLGVHQPKNLFGEEYENFITLKTRYFGVDQNFWHGVPWSPVKSEDRKVLKFLNGISELFSPQYHKLKNQRGIDEHLQAITDREAIKKRSVQFTFPNDRADLVCRDGDIPSMQSACNPEPDSTLYSVEFFAEKGQIPEHYTSGQDKEIIELEAGGFLVVPPYAVIQRISVKENPDSPSGVDKEFWEDYRGVAIDWGNAFSKFKQLQKEMKLSWNDILISQYRSARLDELRELAYWYRKMLYHYGRVQEADLYAHFSPVGFIIDTDLLKENSPDFTDALGPENIWARITKAGEDKFYRVEYGDEEDQEKLTEEQKRNKEKQYIKDKKNKIKLINTGTADTPYIKKVIKAYVEGDKEAEKQLYHEPDKHQP